MTEALPTTAERICETRILVGELGQVCERAGGRLEEQGGKQRWTFEDGSAFIAGTPDGSGFILGTGFAGCWCWQARGHECGLERAEISDHNA